jgi:hypothetical protein
MASMMFDQMVKEVRFLTEHRWYEVDAIRAVAHKYDVPDYELAYYMLGL